jgi:hypothetical protein
MDDRQCIKPVGMSRFSKCSRVAPCTFCTRYAFPPSNWCHIWSPYCQASMTFISIGFSLKVMVNPLSRTLAIDNCKCQDAGGQYNDLTKACCINQTAISYATYPGPNHQVCSSSSCFMLKINWNSKMYSARITHLGGRSISKTWVGYIALQ